MPKGQYERGPFSRGYALTGPAEVVFWFRVNKDGPVHPEHGQCWLWLGRPVPGGMGYGQFRGKGAHRVSYTLTYGEVETGLQVLHKCDRPNCVNPDHLFLGTPADNMRDKMLKGRCGPCGPKKPLYGPANPNYRHGRRCKSSAETDRAES